MLKTKIKPLGNRVLIRRSKAPSTKGGILLPDTVQEKPKEGEVVAIGPGKRNEDGRLDPTYVKEGNRVLFSSYAGTEVKNLDNSTEDEYLIMSEDDIMGIIS